MATVSDSRSLDLDQIQGNILAPFRCDHQAYVVVSFRNRRAGAKQWLGALADSITSAADVPVGTKDKRGDKVPPWRNVGLTATGLVTLHPELATGLLPFEAFCSGPLGSRFDESGHLTTTAALLGDVDASDPTYWVFGGPERAPVDAVLTIAADDESTLSDLVSQERERADGARLDVVFAQCGKVLRRDGETGPSIEHFGFADGISQPGIRGFTEAVERNGRQEDAHRPGSPIIAAGEFVLGYPGERRPPARTPRPTPPGWMRDGSFQVFRRLRQDVAGWQAKMAALSRWGTASADVTAKAVGRRPDGTPLARTAAELNDFTYQDDEQGRNTPLYAHIRKMNPRDDEVFRDRSRKLLRRGIPFGRRLESGAADEERGLFFNAYMASIEDQFEFLQRRWANDPTFPSSTLVMYRQQAGAGGTVDGLDPVIGDDAEAARRRVGKRVTREIPSLALGGFVTTTGALYAFAPSLATLRTLAGDFSLTANRRA
jgi:Dyp-type peroxidase family